MNEQLEDQLAAEFPTFFPGLRNGDPQKTLMVFGFAHGDGWFNLIHKLCEEIQATNPPEGFHAVQVKEKFGGLRFYVHGGTEEIHRLIDKAEADSYRTCEQCGSIEGVTTEGKGWIQSLCSKCREA